MPPTELAPAVATFDPPWLAALPDGVAGLIRAAVEPVSVEFGATIFEQGAPPDAYYVVLQGYVRIFFLDRGDEVSLARLGPGDAFGEESLLLGAPRTASARASSDVVLGRLDGSVFRAALDQYPGLREEFGRLSRLRRISDLLHRNPVFAGLSRELLLEVADDLEEIPLVAGQTAFRQGDRPDGLYLVAGGRLTVEITPPSGGTPRRVRLLQGGDLFGELGLVDARPRTATVVADEHATVMRLGLAAFERLCAAEPKTLARLRERDVLYVMNVTDATPIELQPVEPLDAAPLGFDVTPAEEPSPQQVSKRRRRKFPMVHQVDEADCGAACLAMVCRSFGHDISLSAIRFAARTGLAGTSLNGLAQGGQQLGLATRSVKSSADRVGTLALPAILHWGGNHWVVAHQVNGDRVAINDPGVGRRTVGPVELADKWSGYALTAAPTPALADAPHGGLQLAWLKPFFAPYKKRLVVAVLLALAAAGLQMLLPVFSQQVIDTVVVRGDHSALTRIVGEIFAVLFLVTDVTLLQRFVLARLAVRLDFETVSFLSTTLLRLPMRYFQTRRTGDIQRRITGMRQIRQVLVSTGIGTVTSVAQIIGAFSVMVAYSWPMALLFLATSPLYVALTIYSRNRLRPTFDALEEGLGTYQSQQIDAIKGIEAVKAMGAEDRLARRLQRQFAGLQDIMFRSEMTVMVYEAMVVALTLATYSLFLWVGAEQVIHHHLSIGGLIAFNALVLFANGPIVSLLDAYDRVQLVAVLLTRIQDVFDAEPEQGRDHSALVSVPVLDGSVRLSGVGFAYDGDRQILADIDLDVPAGATVAFVGRSGSGKSTLAKCLAGLVVPTSGRIEYDGHDIATLRASELRQRIGFVLQQPYLFSDTIAANIAFGASVAEPDRVARAAEIANAAEFCTELPLGYETRIGDSGLTLSGGQAQRVSIARAVYHEPPVIILDEATSALDAEAERAVKRNLDTLLHGRTAFVVAHRLSTIRDADLICVLERGRIVERGTHEELMARQGLYAYLSAQQLD